MLHGGRWQTKDLAWIGASESGSWEKPRGAFYQTLHFPRKQMAGWPRPEFVTTSPGVARMLWGRDQLDVSTQRMRAAHPMRSRRTDAGSECMGRIFPGGDAYWRCSYLRYDWDATS